MLVSGALATSVGVPPAAGASGADLVLAARLHDLGAVVPGQSVVRTVPLRNAGGEPLELRVRPSNPRLTARLSASPLPPGGEGELRLELKSNVWERGAIAVQALVYSNDPDEPLVKVKLHGTLGPPIDWTPKIPRIGVVRRGSARPPLEVRLGAKDGRPIGPLRVSSPSPLVLANVAAETSGATATVRITLDPSAPLGPLITTLRIETNRAQLPVIELPAVALVVGDLVTRPHQLDFGLVDEGRPVTARITVANRGSRAVQVLGATPNLPVTAEVNVRRAGGADEVTVRLPAPPPLRNLEGYVDLATDHPEEPVVRVPVVGWVAARKPFDHTGTGGGEQLFAFVRAALFTVEDATGNEFLARFLGGARDDRTVSLMVRAAGDAHWLVRSRAVEILGLLQSRLPLETIRRAATDDVDEEVRREALSALVRVTGQEAVPTLVLALQDNDDGVRADAARALGRLGDARAIPALTAALADEDSAVREVAAGALKALGGK